MKQQKKKYNNIEQHINNLKEMKGYYQTAGDVAAVIAIDRAIDKWEKIRLGEIRR